LDPIHETNVIDHPDDFNAWLLAALIPPRRHARLYGVASGILA
jgi:hypothetical protein